MFKRLAAVGVLVAAFALAPAAHADVNAPAVPASHTDSAEGDLLVQILIALGLDVEVLDVDVNADVEASVGG